LAKDYGFTTRTVNISNHYQERLNKTLAHITYARVQLRLDGKTKWLLKDTVLPLLDPCEEFLQYLIDKYLKKDDVQNINISAYLIARIKELRNKINALTSEPKHGM
jgi:hypothetical protein